MENTLKEAEQDYIQRWSVNSRQHFDDGDYEWICDLITKYFSIKPCHRIFEIGCGAGYSTLVFAIRDYRVVSIDDNEEAIKSTKKLLNENDYEVSVVDSNNETVGDIDVLLWKADLIHNLSDVIKVVNENENCFIDMIVLCNPGGQLSNEITKQEYKYLLWGNFTEDEILSAYTQGNIALLHKWALIFSACVFSQLTDKPLLIVERGNKNEIGECLTQIQKDTGSRKICEAYRKIRNAPNGGIRLTSLDNNDDEQYWGAGLYYPI